MLKCRTNIFIFIVLFCPVLFPGAKAHGAPFCVEQEGVPAECLYQDSSSCWREAAKRKGYCSANLSEIALQQKDNSYCIVDSNLAPVCGYQSAESCRVAAGQNGVCFKNSDNQDSSDPYRLERPIFRTN